MIISDQVVGQPLVMFKDSEVAILALSAIIYEGSFAYADDVDKFYKCTASGWTEVGNMGTGATGQIAYWNGATNLTGSNDFTLTGVEGNRTATLFGNILFDQDGFVTHEIKVDAVLSGDEPGSTIQITSGNADAGVGGGFSFVAGSSNSSDGGMIQMGAGTAILGNGGSVQIEAGPSNNTGNGGETLISAGDAVYGNGGKVQIEAGDVSADGIGGSIQLRPGVGAYGKPNGTVQLYNPNNGILGILDIGNLSTSDKWFAFPDVSGSFALGAGTLTNSTVNDPTLEDHTHAIMSSSNPGAAASIVATNSSGFVQLTGLGIGAAPTAFLPFNLVKTATIDDDHYLVGAQMVITGNPHPDSFFTEVDGLSISTTLGATGGFISNVIGLVDSVTVAAGAVGSDATAFQFFLSVGASAYLLGNEIALDGSVLNYGALDGSLFGVRSTVTNQTGGSAVSAVGATQTVTNLATLGALYGNDIYVQNDGTISTNLCGLRITQTGSGSVTGTAYGVYISAIGQGATKYAIYTAGTTPSYFGGAVGIGIATAYQALHVKSGTGWNVHAGGLGNPDYGAAVYLTADQGANQGAIRFRSSAFSFGTSGKPNLSIDYSTTSEAYNGDPGSLTYASAIVFSGDGDTYFEGAGTGLPYGSCWGNEIGWTQANGAQNTWYVISDADMTDGQLNLVTHDGSGKLTVTKAGRYHVVYTVSQTNSGNNKHVQTGIAINGTVQNDGINHVDGLASNIDTMLGGNAILALTAGQYIEIAIRTTDTGTPNIDVDHLNISLVQVGG